MLYVLQRSPFKSVGTAIRANFGGLPQKTIGAQKITSDTDDYVEEGNHMQHLVTVELPGAALHTGEI